MSSTNVAIEFTKPEPSLAHVPKHAGPSTGLKCLLAVVVLVALGLGGGAIGAAVVLADRVHDLERRLDRLGSGARTAANASVRVSSLASANASSLLAGAGAWAPGVEMPFARSDLQTVYCGGEVVLLGGLDAHGHVLSAVTKFDPVNERFDNTSCAPMPTPRYRFGAACVNGEIWVGGGFENGTAGNAGWSMSSVDVYNVAANTWRAGPPLQVARGDLALGVVGTKLYAIGGYDWTYTPLATNEILDLTSTATAAAGWSYAAPMPLPKGDLQAATINGHLYVPGGWNVQRTFMSELVVYDAAADTWQVRAPMSAPRGDHAVTALDGQLYVIGGEMWSGVTSTCDWGWGPVECAVNLIPMHGVEMYSPATDAWTSMAPLPASRFRFAATAIEGRHAEGAIFAFGGHAHGEVAVSSQLAYHHVPQANVYFEA